MALLSLLVFMLLPCFAGASAADAPAGQRTFRIYVWSPLEHLSKAEKTNAPVYFLPGKTWTAISMEYIRFSEAYPLPADGIVRLYEQPDALQPVFELQLPATWQEGLLIFYQEQRGAIAKSAVLPIETSEDSIPQGHALLANLHPGNLAVQVLALREIIKPRETLLVDLAGVDNYQMNLALGAPDGNQWKRVYNGNQVILPEDRYLFLLHPSGESDRWHARHFRLLTE